ncbi:MAG TPA: ATP-binding protein, partial [Coleofasciculaceae cyanobacterium]
DSYVKAKMTLPEVVDSLQANRPIYRASGQQFGEIPALVQQEFMLLEQIIKTTDAGTSTRFGSSSLTSLLLESKSNMDRLRQKIAQLTIEEERWQRDIEARALQWRKLTNLVQWLALAIGLVGSVAALYLFSQLKEELAKRASRVRETNLYLWAVFDNVVDGICILSERGYIQLANAAIGQIFGYQPDELLGKHLQRLIAESFTDDSGRVMTSLVGKNQNKLRLQQETLGRHKQGKTFPMEFVISEMQLDHEHLFIAIVRDITERKQAEVALRSRADELARMTSILAQTTTSLEKRNAELDQFAYIVSHDLKAPLRAIANLSQWLEDDLQTCLTEDTRHQMHLMRGRVHRMEALIDGLLKYSRIGRLCSEVEIVDVEGLLTEVIDSLSPPSHFTVQVEPGMPTLLTQRLPLAQVFANLISNGIKHHDKTQGKLVVSVVEHDNFYEFSVADNGPGIAPEFHEKVFVMFQTLEARDKVENTGVGLAIVKKILDEQGGKISLESQLGYGSIFRFSWPKTLKG